jgi:catechol 2,3-dioxygenase-like lactoylglutathione lyase family enzyme
VKRRTSAWAVLFIALAIGGELAASLAGHTSAAAAAAAPVSRLEVSAVGTIGITVSNMDRALAFYTQVLPFERLTDVEQSGREFELLTGVFGARARTVTLRLGEESLALTEFLAPRGRPIPEDFRPNDAAFQHVAIVVSDMDRAYSRLREHGVAHGSSGPQRLPEWNPGAGGIRAFYFRDPDGHYLEVLQFPPGKGAPQWQRAAPLFLGIDHTAIVTADSDRSLQFYRDMLGMTVAGESENFETEQEHLNNVFGARLRITALRTRSGPGIELLEYLAPRNGRPASPDLATNDIAHWQTTLLTGSLDPVPMLARGHLFSLVSPRAVSTDDAGHSQAMLVRDPDGHALALTRR